MLQAAYYLNRCNERPEVVGERAPHARITSTTQNRDAAEAEIRQHARHTAWSRGCPVVRSIDGDTEHRQTPVPDHYPQ